MEKNEKNEELQNRREFFKKAAKGALPILGAIALAGAPGVVKAAEEAMDCNYSCSYSCSNSCRGNCYGGCSGSCGGGFPIAAKTHVRDLAKAVVAVDVQV